MLAGQSFIFCRQDFIKIVNIDDPVISTPNY